MHEDERMEQSPIRVVIGTETEGVAIDVLGLLHDGAGNAEDREWLSTPIRVTVGGFRAEVPATLRTVELRAFRDGLRGIHATLTGTAELTSIEDWIELRVTATPSGGLDVTGSVRDEPGSENELAFRLHGLDQSFLPPLLDRLDAATHVAG
jgi:hypothetical protein